jgi:hypothetical protein
LKAPPSNLLPAGEKQGVRALIDAPYAIEAAFIKLYRTRTELCQKNLTLTVKYKMVF